MADWENVQPDEYMLLGQNYSAGRPWGIKGITVHHMAGDLSGATCNNVWRNAGTSAHYCVDKNGYITQHVNDTDRAWACGDGIGTGLGNDTTISIEHANDMNNKWTVHAAAIESGSHLVAALCKYYGLGRPEWGVNVFPHKHWSATSCPGELYGSQKDAYMARAQQWYDAMVNGTDAGEAPAVPTTPSVPSAPAHRENTEGVVATNIHYALRMMDGTWLDTVTNFGDGEDGFAGYPCHEHDLMIAWVDNGNLQYQVHTKNHGWQPWIAKADKNDTENGCAGWPGDPIDGVRMYYSTPTGQDYQQVWYRSQTVNRAGWLDVVCDDGGSIAGYTDDYAGFYGESLDRLQACISDHNPF